MPKTHVVKQGEWLQKIARLYGFASWQTLYDDPANESLRNKRPNPDLLYPGDEVIIPDKVRVASLDPDSTYRVTLTPRIPEVLRIQPKLSTGETLAGREYELALGADVHKATIPPSGVIEVPLSGDPSQAKLTITLASGSKQTWELALGNLDPIETLSGLQTRLNNLRYYFGKISTTDGQPDQETQAAICDFQKDHGLSVDGNPNPDTRNKLQEVYGA